MSVLKGPLSAYREVSVRTASQGKLIVMLYDEAIKQTEIAIKLLEEKSKKLDVVHNALIRAQDVITELMAGLDFDRGGEMARNLLSLYLFFNEKLREANLKKSVEILLPVRDFLSDLRSAWAQIAKVRSEDAGTGSVGVNIAG
ncbi:MAG: flagellar export chaperone FliS [Spirochaetales bacterium]|nr:flagellar export chaperone FliS [Spirochaetales bacterium]